MASSQERCDDCKRVEKNFRISSDQPNVLILHVESSLFEAVKREDGGKEKKTKEKEKSKRREKKKGIREKLSASACALRNTKGGSLLVHLYGQKKENRYLGFFDEFVSDAFTYLIEDGKLYVETYRRFWLDNLRKFKSDVGFVCINVDKSSSVSIVDFYSKIRNDFEITKPSPLNIFTYFKSFTSSLGDKKKSVDRTSEAPKVRGIETSDLQECRTVELKSVSKCEQIAEHTNVLDFVEYVWNDLKLKHYIVSMSKVDDGGHYYLGIAEKSPDRNQCNKKPELQGFNLCKPIVEYKNELLCKFRSNILVLNPDLTFADAPDDLTTVTFHPFNTKFILEVSIRKFNGLVFCDKEGPLAYVITNNDIQRMSKEEVLDRALRLTPSNATISL